jgi:Acetyltransferase (GNAT) family
MQMDESQSGPILAGWSTRKIATRQYYQCPSCKEVHDSLGWGQDRLAECFKCKQRSPVDSFGSVTKKRTLAKCAHCSAEVWFVPMNYGFLGYVCPNCQNHVAIRYGHTRLQPARALNVGWNSSVLKRGMPLDPSLLFVLCKSKKDYLVLNLLQVIVKAEDSRFILSPPNEHYAALLLDRETMKYLGFMCWTEKENAVIRQIFVLKAERRKGYAQKMVAFWIDRYAKPLNEKFGIELPNEKALELHIKMGHVRREGDRAVGIRCTFVGGS